MENFKVRNKSRDQHRFKEHDKTTSSVTTFEILYNRLNHKSLFDNHYRLYGVCAVIYLKYTAVSFFGSLPPLFEFQKNARKVKILAWRRDNNWTRHRI